VKLDANAVIWSAPERERAGRPLLVLLHGYASHEGDLFQLAPRLPLDPVIASVRAPIAESGGWAWFSYAETGIADPDPADVSEAAAAVLAWLEAFEFTSVTLLGFSQGAAVSLQALRLAPERFASIVALSGFSADGSAPGDRELEVLKPPVFWGRGTRDQIIAAPLIERTELWLPAHATATTRIYEDLAHGVSLDELRDVTEFLREHA
jgi:phospholipase/carboxylesterase